MLGSFRPARLQARGAPGRRGAARGACALGRRPAGTLSSTPRRAHNTRVLYDCPRRLKRSNAPLDTSEGLPTGDLYNFNIAAQVEMPSSSLFSELGGPGMVEDQRAFQLALELSMLSLGEPMPAPASLNSPLGYAPPNDDRAKKSQNMTECVPVPSSEHVAEIVGRQGSCLEI